MLPLELREDSDGILYIDDILEHNVHTKFLYQPNSFKYQFFNIPSTNEYILKYYKFNTLDSDLMAFKKMLMEINKRRERLQEIDFPIGYFIEENEFKGLIIYFYSNALSLRDLSLNYDFNYLSNYYFHTDNPHQNLLMLYLDILTLLEKMMDEKIYYLDVHSGNFVLYNNNVKVIDFEPTQLMFDNINNVSYQRIIDDFIRMVNYTNHKLGLEVNLDNEFNIKGLRNAVKKLERRL